MSSFYFPFPTLTSHMHPDFCFSHSWLLLFTCMYIYTHIYKQVYTFIYTIHFPIFPFIYFPNIPIYIHIHSHIHKYNLLCLSNITCIDIISILTIIPFGAFVLFLLLFWDPLSLTRIICVTMALELFIRFLWVHQRFATEDMTALSPESISSK